jgi:hypothetical protein
VLYVPLARVTGQQKYMDSALRAGDYLWAHYGVKGNYQGGCGGCVIFAAPGCTNRGTQ